MTVFQWNCRSIDKNIDYLRQHLSDVTYDILSLQSLNVKKDKLPHLKGYYFPPVFQADKISGKIFTAIYIKTYMNFTSCTSPVPPDINNIYSCAIKVLAKKTPLIIVSTYLPKGPDNFNTEWLRLVNDSNTNNFLITGDFNAHAPFWERNCAITTSTRFIENIVEASLFILNNGAITRIPDNPNHRATSIDLTFISPALAPMCEWCTLDICLNSDHLPLITSFNVNQGHINEDITDKIPKFNYSRANWKLFSQILSAYNINQVNFDSDNIENIYSVFREEILKAAKESIPEIKLKHHTKNAGNIWWNGDCEIARKEKWAAFKFYLKHPSPESLVKSKQAKNKANHVVERAKKEYWLSFCNKEVIEGTNIKKVWEKVKTMCNGIHLPHCQIQTKTSDLLDNEQKAEIFANIFSSSSRTDQLSPERRKYRETYLPNNTRIDLPVESNDNKDNINLEISYEEIISQIRLLTNKHTSVGVDGISNEMISHLPINWIDFLFQFLSKCWTEGQLPTIWKKSIVVPIHKVGKSKEDVSSYRPISLTSHVCKLFERIVLERLNYHCIKNNIIPINQAGFCKNRSTTELLIKLTTQIKLQFSRRKNVLATFFDLRKAYDQIWHAKLIQKLKLFNINGRMLRFLMNFLDNRSIQVRVGNSYSNSKHIDMGLPQGSILSPILFNLFVADLPSIISKEATLVQYADDICLWKSVTLKRNTSKRSINFVKGVYQHELTKIDTYLQENGLSLSVEKTKMMFFSSGSIPENLPTFMMSKTNLHYTNSIKFLGVCLTSKLSWTDHINYILTKSRKALNLLKAISKQKWGQNTGCLRTLACALVRSKMTYAQEVYFNAPMQLLKKLESIDCRSFKLALGVPLHSSTIGTYTEINVLPLHYCRLRACSKFIYKAISMNTFCKEEVKLTRETHFAKRAINVRSTMPIRSYTSKITEKLDLENREVATQINVHSIPLWISKKAFFIINPSGSNKDIPLNILKSNFDSEMESSYANHIKIFTDGSVLDDGNAGAAFLIPTLNVKQFYYLGKNISIYTSELYAIKQALMYLTPAIITHRKLLICVDSMSVLMSLKGSILKHRSFLIDEILQLIHNLTNHHVDITFYWVPSHCGIRFNEEVDKAAKKGAKNDPNSIPLNITLDYHEIKLQIDKFIKECFNEDVKSSKHYHATRCLQSTELTSSGRIFKCISRIRSRKLSSTMFKLRLNAPNTKYKRGVTCLCGDHLHTEHILHHCPLISSNLKMYYSDKLVCRDNLTSETILNDCDNLSIFAEILSSSCIGHLF